MKSKRGSHVGMMLSFSIFIIFLLFLYAALHPEVSSKKNKKYILESLEDDFLKKIQEDLVILTVYEVSPSHCLNVNIQNYEELSVSIKNSDNQPVNFSRANNNLNIGGDGLIKIYLSEEQFQDYNGGGINCQDANITSIIVKEEIFETKILEVISEYENNYISLNSELLPSEYNFGFSFEFANGSVIEEEEKRTMGEIYVKEIDVHYINTTADLVNGKLVLKIW